MTGTWAESEAATRGFGLREAHGRARATLSPSRFSQERRSRWLLQHERRRQRKSTRRQDFDL